MRAVILSTMPQGGKSRSDERNLEPQGSKSAQVVIENPILNSPFHEPRRHFRFDDEGITNEIVEGRRSSTYFVPIAKSKKQGGQKSFDTEWTNDRIKPNEDVDRLRHRVGQWRIGGYAGVTPTTRRLLEHWTDPERSNRLFFCQIEALETAIYIAEVAKKFGDGWVDDWLRAQNDTSNPGLPRVAHKMATGSGKTVVMAMLIAWQVLNKVANSQDAKFTDTFLIIAPGITIRDRLRVLLPNDVENYYRLRDLVPGDLAQHLHRATIVITNFHAFQLREKLKAPALTKKMLGAKDPSLFKETPDEMVRRVCKAFGSKKNIIVLNDEAHHCYRRRPEDDEKLKGEDLAESKKRNEDARIWISGIEAIKNKIGIKTIYDLSATPFFLRGSGYSEGTLFPWVVSDFSLIDAIEAGIVKIPRVPVSDNSMVGEQPTYRDLWIRIKDALPKKGRGTEGVSVQAKSPAEAQGAIQPLALVSEKQSRRGEGSAVRQRGQTPPVFIVVCNNTNVSKMVFDFVSGFEKPNPNAQAKEDAPVLVPGELPIFSNVKDGQWLHRPNTILVDSEQLESGEAMTAEFKKIAHREVEEFKNEYRLRYPGRDADKLTDEDILREVMNTVGKPGKLGEHVKCVVSVSMLTEGWDANTVTHILGVRAFGTQLLCEQVVGRGLRRMSYVVDENGMFEPEYAEVYGVPFSFIPSGGTGGDPKPRPPITRVRALESRFDCEIEFPRLIGYKYEVPAERLAAKFSDDSLLVLSTQMIPTKVENAPIVGETNIHTLDELRQRRDQEVAFLLAKIVVERYFRDDDGCPRMDLFPQVLPIAREWLANHVQCKDNTFRQLLLFVEPAHLAAEKIYRAIVSSRPEEMRLKPVLRGFEDTGSTRYVDFDTTKETYATDPQKCHVSHVVMDSGWEAKMAQMLEEMPDVVAYVKNQGLGFTIPYTIEGEERNYVPDFIVSLRDGANLIIEVTGEKKKDKEVKVATAREMWIPAVNNKEGVGEWQILLEL